MKPPYVIEKVHQHISQHD